MSVINSTPLLAAAGGDYQISRSVRLRSSASAYLNRTPASVGNLQKYTWSGWVKRGTLPSSGNIGLFTVGATDAASDGLLFSGAGVLFLFFANATYSLTTSAIFRDPSAWYHIVFSVDTTQATASDRVSLYVNGVKVTSFSSASYPTQNYNCYFNSAAIHAIGRQQQTSPANYFDGYLTEVNFIDGQALTPSSFGETDAVTGVWKPKKYAGTYGTNGFYLNFSDNSSNTATTIGKDNSGNGNNWTPNNISVTAGVTYDSMLDVPTMWADGGNGRGNYAVLNPVWKSSTASTSNANLSLSQTAALDVSQTTVGVSSGKWYWEAAVTSVGATPTPMIGVVKGGGLDSYTSANAYYYYGNSGQKFISGSASAYGATYTTNDVVGVALDMDAGTLTFYKNNTSQGTATTGLSGEFFPAFSNGGGGTPSWSAALNFGQRPFAYTPPTGFKALNTQNLPEATIKKGNQYFDATTYTGNGDISQTRIISNGNFQPDLVWVKSRSAANGHALQDSIRGAGGILRTELTAAELTGRTDILNGFSSTGFVVGGDVLTNANAATYVGWQWKESASAGFDIVTYTGTGVNRTVAHSLGVAPKMVIVKTRSLAGENWNCWHTSLNNTAARILLNTTGAVDTGSPTIWGTGGINPTSTTFQVGSSSGTNGNGSTYVAYLFSEVAGFSKFGSYTGNGSADGPFVYCGFRPRYVLVKNINDGTGQWIVNDSARGAYNQPANALYPNLSNAEDTSHPIDFYSNGFKVRSSAAHSNGSGNTLIYAAFAENPFKNSLAR